MTFSRRITPIPTRDALSDVKSVNRKVTIDPLSLVIHQHAAWVYIHARRYDTAIEECRKALEIDPNYSLGHFWMGIALSQNSRHEDAITALENQSPGASRFEENVRSSVPRRRRRTGADPVFARHASVQTTERYIGCKQDLCRAVNDRLSFASRTGNAAKAP